MSCVREDGSIFSSFFPTSGKQLDKVSHVFDVPSWDDLVE